MATSSHVFHSNCVLVAGGLKVSEIMLFRQLPPEARPSNQVSPLKRQRIDQPILFTRSDRHSARPLTRRNPNTVNVRFSTHTSRPLRLASTTHNGAPGYFVLVYLAFLVGAYRVLWHCTLLHGLTIFRALVSILHACLMFPLLLDPATPCALGSHAPEPNRYGERGSDCHLTFLSQVDASDSAVSGCRFSGETLKSCYSWLRLVLFRGCHPTDKSVRCAGETPAAVVSKIFLHARGLTLQISDFG